MVARQSFDRVDIAKFADVSEATVTRWIESGQLPAWDASANGGIHKHWRVWADHWDEFQKNRGTAAFADIELGVTKVTPVSKPEKTYFK